MTKTKAREEHPYNYLYDKCSKLCSSTNHDRAVYRAKTFANISKNKPVFQNMYSDLKAYPRSKVFKESSKVIPQWFLKDYSSYMKQINSYVLRYAGLGCDVSKLDHMIPTLYKRDPEPNGMDRCLYFSNPIIPRSVMLLPDVMLASIRAKQAYYKKRNEKTFDTTRTVGTQTIYRDSTAQTDPYSPEFLLRPGAEPEILTLIPLSYRNGLPAGLHEVEMIERARRHRLVEKMYPDLVDIGDARKRRAALNKLEIEEWKIREKQIDELQMARLEVVIKLLKERKENKERVHNESLERVCLERIKAREEKQTIVQYEYVKAIRKLLQARRNSHHMKADKSLIGEYGNPMSISWAPLARIGQFFDRGSQRYVVDNDYLTTFNGLCDLERGIPSFVLNPTIKLPQPNNYTKDGYKNKKFRLEEELTELYKHIKTKNQIILQEKNKPLKFLIKNEKPITRPRTPTKEFLEEKNVEVELSIIFLQQLVKGRAIQVMMYEAKEKRIQLIAEIQSTHALHEEEIEVKLQEKAIILAHQRNQMLYESNESTIGEIIESLEGQSLGEMCDFLGKELIRLQEERRLHAFAMMAIRERRMREAEESGLRQMEERRRREEDEIFKQIVKVNQSTVETYMADIISENIDLNAEDVARNDIEKMAIEINNTAYEIEYLRDYLRTEEVVSDLVHHFLIPEVYKTEARERIALNQRKYLIQAHRVIVEATEDVVKHLKEDVSTNTKPESDVSLDEQIESDETVE